MGWGDHEMRCELDSESLLLFGFLLVAVAILSVAQ